MGEHEQLERLIRNGRPELRRCALERLINEGHRLDTALLEELSASADADIRSLAARAVQLMAKRRTRPPALDGAPVGPPTSPRFRVHELKAAAMRVLEPCMDRLLAIGTDDPDVDVARQAVEALGRLRNWATIDGLLALLPRDGLTAQAALALAAIGDLRVVAPVVAAVREATVDRRAAILALGAFKTRDSLAQLVAYLRDDDEEVRAQAALTLREHVGDPVAREALLEALHDPARRVNVNALLALKSVDDDDVTETVVALFDESDDDHVRATVLSALHGTTGHRDEVTVVIERALADPCDRVRANALEALATLDLPPDLVRRWVMRLVDDPDNRVRANVARALGTVEPAVSLGLIRSMATSDDKWVRASAMFVGRFVDEPAVGSWLVSVLADEPDDDVLRNAVGSLDFHRAPSLTDEVVPLLRHGRPAVRSAAAQVLAGRGDPRSAPELMRRLVVEPDGAVRAHLVAALGTSGSDEAASALCEALRTDDVAVQHAALQALDRLGRLETVPAMVPFLHSADFGLRACAAVALWHQGWLIVVEALASMLEHPDRRFRCSAIQALGTIGDELPTLGQGPRSLHLCSALVGSDEATDEEPAAAVEPLEAGPVDEAPIDALLGPLQLTRHGSPTAALTAIDDLAASFPDDSAVRYLRGLCLRRAGDGAKAAQVWADGVDGVYPALVEAAGVLQQADDAHAAYRAYLQAFRHKQAFVGTVIERAEALLAAGRLVELSLVVRELLVAEPLDGASFQRLGLALLKARDYDEARRLLRMALVLAPDSASVQFNLALACYHLQHFDECRVLVHHVVETVPAESPEAQRSRQLLKMLP